jgi:hypothetical protein
MRAILFLDLRDTPGGGNTDVAEPIIGGFIDHQRPYQRIEPMRGRRWLRHVAPLSAIGSVRSSVGSLLPTRTRSGDRLDAPMTAPPPPFRERAFRYETLNPEDGFRPAAGAHARAFHP